MGDGITTRIKLSKPEYGSNSWYSKLNNNFDLIDSAYGDILSSVPNLEVSSGSFSVGTVISLSRTVDNLANYNVAITPTENPTTDGKTLGSIYIVKELTQFTVYRTGDCITTFSASVEYVTDYDSYGMELQSRYFVSDDAGITDHADASVNGSLANVLVSIGTNDATIEFPGNHQYPITWSKAYHASSALEFLDTNKRIRDLNVNFTTLGFVAGMPIHIESLLNTGIYHLDTVGTTGMIVLEDLVAELGATRTSSTISFTAATKKIQDLSLASFAGLGFASGMKINIASTSNTGTYTLGTVGTTAMYVLEDLVDEATGTSFSIDSAFSVRFAIPDNVTLAMQKGAILLPSDITGAGTGDELPDLYIHGAVEVEPTQRWLSKGNDGITAFRNKINVAYPNWWGAVDDNSTECGIYHTYAQHSLERGTVFLPNTSGTYYYSTGVWCKSNINHMSDGAKIRSVASVHVDDSWDATIDPEAFQADKELLYLFVVGKGRTAYVTENVEIAGFELFGGATPLDSRGAIVLRRVIKNIKIHDLHLYDFLNESIVFADADTVDTQTYFENVDVWNIKCDGYCGQPSAGSGINFFPRSQTYDSAAIETMVSDGAGIITDPYVTKVTMTLHGLETNDFVQFAGITQADWKGLNDDYGLTHAQWGALNYGYIVKSNHFVITKVDVDNFTVLFDSHLFASAYVNTDPGVVRYNHRPKSKSLRIHDCYFDVTNGLTSISGSGDPVATHGPQSIKINNVDGLEINNIQAVGGDISGITISTSTRNAHISNINMKMSNRGVVVSSGGHSSGCGIGRTQNISISNISYDDFGLTEPTGADRYVIEIQNDCENITISNIVSKGIIALSIIKAHPFDIVNTVDLIDYYRIPNERIGRMYGLNINNVSLTDGLIYHAAMDYRKFDDSAYQIELLPIIAPNISNVSLIGGLNTGVGKIQIDGKDSGRTEPDPNLLRRKIVGGSFKNIKFIKSDGYSIQNYGDNNTFDDIFGYNCNPDQDASTALVYDKGNNTRISNLTIDGDENYLRYFVQKLGGNGCRISNLSGTPYSSNVEGMYFLDQTQPISGDISLISETISLAGTSTNYLFMATDADYYVSSVSIFYVLGTTDGTPSFKLGKTSSDSYYLNKAIETGKTIGYYKSYISRGDFNTYQRKLPIGDPLILKIGSEGSAGSIKVIVELVKCFASI